MNLEMISFGGGVNSVAMTILLVNEGWHGPIVFADTGGEHPETYCYMAMFERDWLKPRGLGIVRLLPGAEYHCSMSQVPLEEYCLSASVIPLMAVRWCSSRWKGRPMDRWAKERGIQIHYIGFCVDEARRANEKPDYQQFPLLDRGITRGGCARIIQKEGLEVPPKSSCFFCPMQTIGEWQRLFLDHPDLYERAANLERVASERHGKVATLGSHDASLDQMRERRWEGQIEMDLSAWLPCLCTL